MSGRLVSNLATLFWGKPAKNVHIYLKPLPFEVENGGGVPFESLNPLSVFQVAYVHKHFFTKYVSQSNQNLTRQSPMVLCIQNLTAKTLTISVFGVRIYIQTGFLTTRLITKDGRTVLAIISKQHYPLLLYQNIGTKHVWNETNGNIGHRRV